jgi:hypothetical protein
MTDVTRAEPACLRCGTATEHELAYAGRGRAALGVTADAWTSPLPGRR